MEATLNAPPGMDAPGYPDSDCPGDDEIFPDEATPKGTLVSFVCGGTDRLDKFLASHIDHVSREKIKRAIQDGACLIDGRPCTEPKTKVHAGQRVELQLEDETSSLVPTQLHLKYVFSNETLTIVNKPAGLTVHPCPSCTETTLVHGILHDYPQLGAMGGLRPGIVHRLDKDTSGVMVVALTESLRLQLTEAFAERRVHKTYLALVHGVPAASGSCKAPIGRHPTKKVKMAVVSNGRTAHTDWVRVYADPEGQFSLLKVVLHTGRTHQIRVHMQHIGHPLLGDTVYGLPEKFPPCPAAARQMLHAWQLQLPSELVIRQVASPHAPDTNAVSHETHMVTFTAPLPLDFVGTALNIHKTQTWVVVTGCPGCGKSAVLESLRQRGYAVCSADELVQDLYAPNTPLWHALRFRFGVDIIDAATGQINKARLFAMMCEDPAVRHEVNQLVHPVVSENIRAFLDSTASDTTIGIVEIPLWFEATQQDARLKPDCVVNVFCDDAIRLPRLEVTRGWSATKCAAMDSWQLSQEEKNRRADYVVHNTGSLEDLEVAVTQLEETILATHRKKAQALLSALEAFR